MRNDTNDSPNGLNQLTYDYEESFSKIAAKRIEDNELVYVYASEVTKKDGPFYCPDSFEPLIVRKCIEKINHFAYSFRRNPVGSKESDYISVWRNTWSVRLDRL